MTAPWHSAVVTDVAFHSTHRKEYQSELLFFHSKGGRCSSWGLLHCDDRRSPWWASRDGPQRDRSRSDTGMISMNFNSYASLVIFFIIPVLFCFVLDHETLLTIRVLAVSGFITVHKLAIALSVKTSKTWTVHFVFSLRIFVSAHVLIGTLSSQDGNASEDFN